jgi:AcrR family transcriptional regulator
MDARPSLENPLTQAERRARTRDALLESAARGLSRYGYDGLALERVAAAAGYTRGALYHLFDGKEALSLAVVGWVAETWWDEVVPQAEREADPLASMLALARGHAIFCRREVARVISTLRAEFGDREHPVGLAVAEAMENLVGLFAELIIAGRRKGSVPPGPETKVLAPGVVGAIEGAVIASAGNAPFDVLVAERALLGLLGLDAGARPGQS